MRHLCRQGRGERGDSPPHSRNEQLFRQGKLNFWASADSHCCPIFSSFLPPNPYFPPFSFRATGAQLLLLFSLCLTVWEKWFRSKSHDINRKGGAAKRFILYSTLLRLYRPFSCLDSVHKSEGGPWPQIRPLIHQRAQLFFLCGFCFVFTGAQVPVAIFQEDGFFSNETYLRYTPDLTKDLVSIQLNMLSTLDFPQIY